MGPGDRKGFYSELLFPEPSGASSAPNSPFTLSNISVVFDFLPNCIPLPFGAAVLILNGLDVCFHSAKGISK